MNPALKNYILDKFSVEDMLEYVDVDPKDFLWMLGRKGYSLRIFEELMEADYQYELPLDFSEED